MADINLDIKTNKIVLSENKDIDLVDNEKELNIWIYKTLNTQRKRYKIYTDNYGVETENLIGSKYEQEFINAEVKRNIVEALMKNISIKEVKNFAFNFNGSKLLVSFDVVTEYNTGGLIYEL